MANGEVGLANREAQPRRKIAILTSHAFLRGYRKASIHFIASRWAEQGHEVHFLTIGHSWLTLLKDRRRFRALSQDQANRFQIIATNLSAGAYLPPLHAFSSGNRFLNAVNSILFRLYGSYFPPFARRVITDADLILVESGSPLAFFAKAKRLNPKARILYFCRDLLRTIGAAPALQDIQAREIARFDAVCVPSERLGAMLPPGGRVRVIPQGIDASLFDREQPSPYPPGSRNAISIGNMLFDQASVAAMAAAAPDVNFHVFGAAWTGWVRPNITIYGERDFESIIPYLQHADFGIAPYRLTADEVYLAESSLKLAQYSYCGLPILLPDLVPFTRPNGIAYRLEGEVAWREKIDAALTMRRSVAFRDGIMTWDEVAQQTLAAAYETH
ncbi:MULTISPECIES: polysaccharide biosynthesis protein GumK [unclassified Rhizobium]|uniref:GumK N-terminal domain-containing glycosyltransferase n=1 Tax=unclassified Rhizobium TaxID=2613769 RepID=UPI000A83071C|nr:MULTISPECIES: polysaccharide biosynthesis protein GumK [unclassified Rhizobium]MBN8952173.1 polysaccharide biosynthesis protein GumK [Rhizobium tropici]RKD66775.1 2-beta-glucuronyltransferase [Rhizobium sp. WW_1]